MTFQSGGLHQTTGTPIGMNIPSQKMAAAAAGRYGPKGKKQAVFARGALAKGRQTAAKNRKRTPADVEAGNFGI